MYMTNLRPDIRVAGVNCAGAGGNVEKPGLLDKHTSEESSTVGENKRIRINVVPKARRNKCEVSALVTNFVTDHILNGSGECELERLIGFGSCEPIESQREDVTADEVCLVMVWDREVADSPDEVDRL